MNLNELSNEQIVFLYLRNNETLIALTTMIEKKIATETIEILDQGVISVSTILNDEDVKTIEEGDYYKNVVAINEKLEPIAQLIEDVDPTMYQRVKNCLNQIF